MGWRLGIWNTGFLLCIPIFLFLFAVYYSVSALSGAIWRNPIICVVMTVLFWFACFGVGLTKGMFDAFFVETKKVVRLVQADDTLFSINERGEASRWNSESDEWEQAFLDGNLGDMRHLGPVYDADAQTLMAATTRAPAISSRIVCLWGVKETAGGKSKALRCPVTPRTAARSRRPLVGGELLGRA